MLTCPCRISLRNLFVELDSELIQKTGLACLNSLTELGNLRAIPSTKLPDNVVLMPADNYLKSFSGIKHPVKQFSQINNKLHDLLNQNFNLIKFHKMKRK